MENIGFSRIGPFRTDHVFDPKNLQKWPPKSIKIRSKIDQKKRFKKWPDFDQKNDQKVTPKWTPKSTNNRSWGQLGPQEGPKRIQEGSRDRIWTIFDRFGTEFWPFLDRFGTEFGPIWTDSRPLFYPGSRVNANCLSMWFQALPKHFQSESSDRRKRLLTLPLVIHANFEKGMWKIGDLP